MYALLGDVSASWEVRTVHTEWAYPRLKMGALRYVSFAPVQLPELGREVPFAWGSSNQPGSTAGRHCPHPLETCNAEGKDRLAQNVGPPNKGALEFRTKDRSEVQGHYLWY